MRCRLGREMGMGTDMGRDTRSMVVAGTHTPRDSGWDTRARAPVTSTSTSGSKPYAIVECGGGLDVVHEPEYGGGRGGRRDEGTGRDAGDVEEEEDVDIVGDADGSALYYSCVLLVIPLTPRQLRLHESGLAYRGANATVRGSKRSPSRRACARRRCGGGGRMPAGRRFQFRRHEPCPPPRVDKGKGKTVLRDSTMDVDAEEQPPLPPWLLLAPPPPPPHFQFQPPLPPPQLPPSPSPSTSFVVLSLWSPHPSGPRPAWFSVGAGANVKVLEHGDSAGVRWGRRGNGDGCNDMGCGCGVLGHSHQDFAVCGGDAVIVLKDIKYL
ncbi:hypothetical protein B0H14DRAFT_1310758 [Mycena olivaceomarginata]|nr:hypothetical protein B0H14DRAFT_1310758 [Mycena olivaceomarginata]